MLKNINYHGKLPVIFAGFLFTLFICLVYIYRPGVMKLLNYEVYDIILKSTYVPHMSDHVVIVDLDEKSMSKFGQWPWARYRVAILLEKLRQRGAICVGMDILFAERDRTSPSVLRANLKKDLNVSVSFDGLPEGLMDNDKIFANILNQGRYVMGFFFDETYQLMTVTEDKFHDIKPAIHMGKDAGNLEDYIYNFNKGIFPIQELSAACKGLGFINSRPDDDGIIRNVPLLINMNGKIYPSLGLAVLRAAMGNPTVVVKMAKWGIESLKIGKNIISVDPKGRMFLNFRGPKETFSYYSAADVMEGNVSQDAFLNKIVLVGTTAAGLKDLRATPIESIFPGVEVQATAIDNILKNDYIKRPDWTPGLEVGLIVIFGVLTAIFISLSSPLWTIPLVVVSAYGVWVSGIYSFQNWRIYISPLYPLIMLFGNFALLSFIKFWNNEREKGFVRSTFGRYLSTSIVKEILDTPGGLNLGGDRKLVTIMMTDLRGFTALCERLQPEEVVSVVNNYLRTMTPIIARYGGTIDEFIGDAILALFGAPIKRKDDAARAVACAVEMQNAMEEVNRKNRGQGLPEVFQGIGLHTGEAIIGNIGSEIRSKYGIVGKNVNYTARVESYTVGGQVFISQETKDAIGDILDIKGEMEVKPKGVKGTTTIYEVEGINGEYNVYYTEKEDVPFVPLREKAYVHITVLEGKHAGDEEVIGEILELSGVRAKISSKLPVKRLDNFKMSLVDKDDNEITKDLYAKAVDVINETQFVTNFTSVPPEAHQFFENIVSRQMKNQ